MEFDPLEIMSEYRQRFSVNMTRTLLGMKVCCQRFGINITALILRSAQLKWTCHSIGENDEWNWIC